MDLTYGQPSRDRGRDGQRPHDGDEARRRGRVGFRRQLRDAMPPCVASTIHVENRGPRAKVQRARCDRHQVLAGGPSVWRRRTQTLDAVVPAAVFGRYGIVQIEVASDGTGGRILEIGERRLSTHKSRSTICYLAARKLSLKLVDRKKSIRALPQAEQRPPPGARGAARGLSVYRRMPATLLVTLGIWLSPATDPCKRSCAAAK